MKTNEVIRRFAERVPNPRDGGRVNWRGNVGYGGPQSGWGGQGHVGARIYCEGDSLFSYGHHWRLAIYLGEKNGKPVFLKNGDRASVTTNSQLAVVQGMCPGPTVSFSAID